MGALGWFEFWRRYMLALSVIFALQGILTALTASPDAFGIYARILSLHFWGTPAAPSEVEAFRKFILAPMGGTLAGYFVLVLYITLYPFRERKVWAHSAITAGILIWFITDSAMTIYHGAYFNMYLVNLPTLVLWGLPLLFTRRYMH